MSAAGGDFYAAGCVVRRQFIGKISARPQSEKEEGESGREERKNGKARRKRKEQSGNVDIDLSVNLQTL